MITAVLVLVVGAVLAYFSSRHMMRRYKVEQTGDTTTYRQGLKALLLESAWVLFSWLLFVWGIAMVLIARATGG